jgi:hypothetical protein
LPYDNDDNNVYRVTKCIILHKSADQPKA